MNQVVNFSNPVASSVKGQVQIQQLNKFFPKEGEQLQVLEQINLGSRLADLHLILPNEVPQLSC